MLSQISVLTPLCLSTPISISRKSSSLHPILLQHACFDPLDHSLLCFSVHGILQARILEWVVICPSPGDLPGSGIKPGSPVSPALAGGFFTTEPPGKPHPASRLLPKFLSVNSAGEPLWASFTISTLCTYGHILSP